MWNVPAKCMYGYFASVAEMINIPAFKMHQCYIQPGITGNKLRKGCKENMINYF